MFTSIFQLPGQKLIVLLDPSSLSTSACPRNFLYNNLSGYTNKTREAATYFGQVVHKAIARWRIGEAASVCMSEASFEYSEAGLEREGDIRTGDLVMSVLGEYFQGCYKDKFQVSKNTIGKPGVELSFELPFRAYDEVDFSLAGVIDAVGMLDTSPRFLDIKTTSLHPKKFPMTWGTSAQMMLYSWVLKEMGYSERYLSPIIDCLFLRLNPGQRYMRLTDNLVEKSQVLTYMEWVWDYCDEIYKWLKAEKFLMNRNCCQRVYGPCQFKKICDVSEETMKSSMLGTMFKQKEYNPATFSEE